MVSNPSRIREYTLLDRWILERLHSVTAECLAAYEAYEFRKVFNSLNNFCTARSLRHLHRCDEGPHVLRRRGFPAPRGLADGDARDLHQHRQAARARSSPSPPTRRGSTRLSPAAPSTSRISPRRIPRSRPARRRSRWPACLKSNTPSRPPSRPASRQGIHPQQRGGRRANDSRQRRRPVGNAQRPRLRHRVLHHRRPHRHAWARNSAPPPARRITAALPALPETRAAAGKRAVRAL